MQLRTNALVALLLVPLVGACLVDRGTTNEPLASQAVAAFEPGTTTARDVVEALGAPVEVVQLGLRSAYRYEFIVSKRAGFSIIVVTLVGRDTRSDRAWLFFDQHDVLTHVGASFDSEDAHYALPWSKAHE